MKPGCYLEIKEGQEPHEKCVLDIKNGPMCAHADVIDRKEQCEYWKISPRKGKTNRGFNFYTFLDRYDEMCSIQESSLATEPALWIGIHDATPKILASKTPEGGTGWVNYDIPEDVFISTRMHITIPEAKFIIKVLQQFIETGGL